MTTVEAGERRWHGTTQKERTEAARAAANARWAAFRQARTELDPDENSA